MSVLDKARRLARPEPDTPRAPGFRLLSAGPLRHAGLWSYSIYLWQQPFSAKPAEYGLDVAPWFLSFPLWALSAVGAGILSYYLIERPFLALKPHPEFAARPKEAG